MDYVSICILCIWQFIIIIIIILVFMNSSSYVFIDHPFDLRNP